MIITFHDTLSAEGATQLVHIPSKSAKHGIQACHVACKFYLPITTCWPAGQSIWAQADFLQPHYMFACMVRMRALPQTASGCVLRGVTLSRSLITWLGKLLPGNNHRCIQGEWLGRVLCAVLHSENAGPEMAKIYSVGQHTMAVNPPGGSQMKQPSSPLFVFRGSALQWGQSGP